MGGTRTETGSGSGTGTGTGSVSTIGGGAGIRRFRPRAGHQNNLFRGWNDTIPYMIGKLAPESTHFTRGLVK